MKTKTTLVSSDEKSLTVSIFVKDDKSPIDENYNIEIPFCVIPPQIAHQIASQIAMCNSYIVENESPSK